MKRNRSKIWEFLSDEEFSEPIRPQRSGNPVEIEVYEYRHLTHDTSGNKIPTQFQRFCLYPVGSVVFNSGIKGIDIEEVIYDLCNYHYTEKENTDADAYIKPTIYSDGVIGSGMLFEFEGTWTVCLPIGWSHASSLKEALNLLEQDEFWKSHRLADNLEYQVQRDYGYPPYPGLEDMQEDILFWYNMEVKKTSEISYASFFNFWWDLYNK